MVCWEVWIPTQADYVFVLTIYFPITWLVQGENPPLLSFARHGCLFKLRPEPCLISTQNRFHMDLWSAWLVLTPHHHFHRYQLPLHKNPISERVSWLFCISCHLPSVPVRFIGYLELFSNSPLSVLRECSPWVHLRSHGPASHLGMTITTLSEWTRAW